MNVIQVLINRIKGFWTSRFVREVFSLQVGKSLSLLIGLAASIVIARVLGPENYGIYAIVISLTGMISGLINFGVWPATMTLFSEAIGRNDRAEVKNLVIYFIKITLIATNALWLLVMIFAPQLVVLIYGDSSLASFFRLAILVDILGAFFPLITLCYQIYRRIYAITIWELLKKLVGSGSAVILVFAGVGVAGLFYGLLIAEAFFLFFALYMFWRLPKIFPILPSWLEVIKDFGRVKIGKYFKFGIQNAADKNLNNYVETTPAFLLGVLSTPEQAGFFQVAYRIGTLPKVFSSNISRLLSTIYPFKEATHSGSVAENYHRVAKYGSIFTLMSMVAVFSGTLLLFRFLYGEEFLPALPALFVILSFNLLMGFAVSFGPIIRTLKKVSASIRLNILALLLTLCIGFYTIPRWGALGAAVSHVGWFMMSLILIYKIETWLRKI